MIIRVNEVNNEIRVLLNQPCDFGSRAPSLSYYVLQVSCPGETGSRQLEMSLCKLLASVLH